jgi:hypothetical protein
MLDFTVGEATAIVASAISFCGLVFAVVKYAIHTTVSAINERIDAQTTAVSDLGQDLQDEVNRLEKKDKELDISIDKLEVVTSKRVQVVQDRLTDHKRECKNNNDRLIEEVKTISRDNYKARLATQKDLGTMISRVEVESKTKDIWDSIDRIREKGDSS